MRSLLRGLAACALLMACAMSLAQAGRPIVLPPSLQVHSEGSLPIHARSRGDNPNGSRQTHASSISPAGGQSPSSARSEGVGDVRITGLGKSSAPWSVLVLMTFLTLVPSLLICVTPFARLLVVFHFLRQALGLQTTPSNQTLIGLSMILTFFLMQPVGKEIYEGSIVPLQDGQITAFDAVARGSCRCDGLWRVMCGRRT